jgi:RNA-directed DNA polymerase
MEPWSTHHLYQEASNSLDSDSAASLQRYAQNLISNRVAVVFTLGHLSRITGVADQSLHDSVNRTRESSNYRMYAVKKRSGGRRFIHSVSRELFKVQRFVNQEILQKCVPHPSSFAFHKSGGIRKCAAMHCGARWLFQFDLADFFYNITEVDAYRIFKGMGYRSLLAFELGRLCTTTHLPRWHKQRLQNEEREYFRRHNAKGDRSNPSLKEIEAKYPRRFGLAGVLPQGAPTSPMLSNLAAQELDESLQEFSLAEGLVYTRYVDDITFSASSLPRSQTVGNIHRSVLSRIRKAGFRENHKKTRVARPGSKKVVLGLLVDGKEPRISKETYRRIDRHLHASDKYGLSETASHEGFDSAFGFHNHLSGLIAFVKDVDQKRWEDFAWRLREIATPW